MSTISDLLRQGIARDKAGRHNEAAEIYERVLRLDPDNADASYLMGLALLDLGETRRAREYVEKAVKARPYNANFCCNYAEIVASIGDHDLAQSYYRRAIEAKPDHAMAWLGLSGTVSGRKEQRLLEDIEQLLLDNKRSEADRALLYFAAGKLADDSHEPERAFQHFASGNRAAARSFDLPAHQDETMRLIEVFNSERFSRLQGAGSDSDAMVFIVGMPRSGSTLIEQILTQHPLVHSAGERSDIMTISTILPRQDPGGRHFPDCVPHLGVPTFGAFADRYLTILRRKNDTARRLVDKGLLNYRYLGLIALMFPRARIVHCRRDPVDTCLSCYFQYFENVDFAFDLGHIAGVYRDYRTLMDHWREHLPNPILDIDYESVVADHGGEARRLIEFCGLPWDEACLRFETSANPVRTASQWQVRQPIYSTSVARAGKYAAHLGPLLEELSPFLKSA